MKEKENNNVAKEGQDFDGVQFTCINDDTIFTLKREGEKYQVHWGNCKTEHGYTASGVRLAFFVKDWVMLNTEQVAQESDTSKGINKLKYQFMNTADTKRYIYINGMINELLPENDLKEPFVFEWNGEYKLEISNVDGVLRVTNGVNGWGNNCKDDFRNAEVKVLYELSQSVATPEAEIERAAIDNFLQDYLPSLTLLQTIAELIAGDLSQMGIEVDQDQANKYAIDYSRNIVDAVADAMLTHLDNGYKAAIKKDEPDLVAKDDYEPSKIHPQPSEPVASHTCTEGNSIEQVGGYYYNLFKFFSDEHGLMLVDTEIQDIIHVVNKFQNEKD